MIQNSIKWHGIKRDELRDRCVKSVYDFVTVAHIPIDIDNQPMPFFYSTLMHDPRLGQTIDSHRVCLIAELSAHEKFS